MKAVNVDDVLKILHKYGKYIFVTDMKKYFSMVDEIANLKPLSPETITEFKEGEEGHRRKFEGIVVEYPSAEFCIYPEYKGRPYFSIRYEENGEEHIGYGTYNPQVLTRYLQEYFISDIQPKTGHWIVEGSVDCYLDKVRCHCSECGKKKEFPADYDHIKQELSISYKYPEVIDNFCPKCGARMIDPQEEEE